MTETTRIAPGMESLIRRVVKVTGRKAVNVQLSEFGPPGVCDLLGTEVANGEPSAIYADRRTRCYELAACAVLPPYGLAPKGSRVIHGTIKGPGNHYERIGHAWLELPDGLLWEPISGLIHDRNEWMKWASAWEERTYTRGQVIQLIGRHQHYGRWHESRYP